MASTPAARPDTRKDDSPPVGKPPEMEAPSNRLLFHPLARRLARALQPTGISPNAVSVAGAVLVVAAGAAYIGLSWPLSVMVGLLLHSLWHVVDGADGALARLTGKASPGGELVDGACDYVSHFLLYVILGVWLGFQVGFWAYPLGLASGLSRIVQSNHAESQRRTYLWRAYGVPWLQHAEESSDEASGRKRPLARLLGGAGAAYVRLSRAMSTHSEPIEAAIARHGADIAQRTRIRRLCRRASRRSLFLQNMLGANPRTMLLGISMALGSPLYFFIVECTVLNLLLIVSVRHQNACNRRLARRLAPPAGEPLRSS